MKVIPNVITQKVGRELLTIRKNSPRTLFVVGIAGTVVSTVLACRATLKLPELLDDMQKEVNDLKERKNQLVHFNQGSKARETSKDLAYVYGIGVGRIVKLYAPSALLGVASLGALTTSHVQLSRRNASLAAAYSALHAGFEQYRERVREQLGEDKERELYRGVQEQKVEIDGKLKNLKTVDPNKLSVYAKIFDEYNPRWVKNAEQNRMFIQAQQNYANHLLHSRGHVFLNEVYDQLGFPHTQAGSVVGWVLGQGGDDYIDFGMFEATKADFINGYERSIVLDFNVDGMIYDKI